MNELFSDFQLLTKAVEVLSPIDEWGSQIGFIRVSSPQKTRMEFHLGEYDTLAENLNAIGDVAFSNGKVD